MKDFILPAVGESIKPKPSADILGITKNLYAQDSLLAVLREFISNAIQHGKADSVYIIYNGKELTVEDFGFGTTKEKMKYFFLQDFGESGQSMTHFNRWRVGMTSSLEIADRVTFHVKGKNLEFISDIQPDESGFTAHVERMEVLEPRKSTGVTAKFLLNNECMKDINLRKIEDTLKLICYWWIRHQGIKIYINNKLLDYGAEGIEGLVCKSIIQMKDIESTVGNPIEGDVFYKILTYPSWFPPKNYLVLFVDGNFVSSDRIFWGGFNSLMLANTTDATIMTKLNAGKTSIKSFKKTGFYRAVMSYSLQYKEEEVPTKKNEVLKNIVKELLDLADTRAYHQPVDKSITPLQAVIDKAKEQTIIEQEERNLLNPDLIEPKKTEEKKTEDEKTEEKLEEKLNEKVPPKPKEPPKLRDIMIEHISDVTEPFIGLEFNGSEKIIQINSCPKYPTLAGKVNALINNPTIRNLEFIIPFISRVSDSIKHNVEYENNKELFKEKWAREDWKSEVSLMKKYQQIEEIVDTEDVSTNENLSTQNEAIFQPECEVTKI